MITGERCVYIGGHTTKAVKSAIESLARSRRMSVSKLVHEIVSNSPAVRDVMSSHLERYKEKERERAQ